jgi:hypothetical protein
MDEVKLTDVSAIAPEDAVEDAVEAARWSVFRAGDRFADACVVKWRRKDGEGRPVIGRADFLELAARCRDAVHALGDAVGRLRQLVPEDSWMARALPDMDALRKAISEIESLERGRQSYGTKAEWRRLLADRMLSAVCWPLTDTRRVKEAVVRANRRVTA